MKSKNFIIDLVIYPFDIMISIGESDKKIKKKLRKSGIDKSELYLAEYDEICAAQFVLFSSGQSLIRIRKYPKTPFDFGTIQHEIFHVASTILRRMGLKLKIGSSDEAYAYLIGYITKEVYKNMELNKFKKVIKGTSDKLKTEIKLELDRLESEEKNISLYCGRSTIDGAYVSGLYTNLDGNKINGIPVHPWSIGRIINPEIKTWGHKESNPK